MLWRVRDFKGIKSADLDIGRGRVTVLTGVNSSGKSSIIQSLLLAAQSLHSDSTVVLNGPLVRLGDAQDLVREQSEDGAIELTLGVDESSFEEDVLGREVVATFQLSPAEERSTLRVQRLTIVDSLHPNAPLVLSRENSRVSDAKLAKEATQPLGSSEVLHLKSLLGSDRRQLRTYVAMQGLRPVGVVQLMKPSDLAKRYRAIVGVLLKVDDVRHLRHPSAVTSSRWSPTLVREFIQLLGHPTPEIPSDHLQSLLRQVGEFRSGNIYAFERLWQSFDAQDRELLVDMAVDARAKRPWVTVPLSGRGLWTPRLVAGVLETNLADLVDNSQASLTALHRTLDQLSERVQYLGPLRDEPRVVWNHWNELAYGLPVGTRGEYSAAVLSRFGSRAKAYVDPTGLAKRATLAEAVNAWLTYLRIGDDVTARPQGKLGVGFDLKVDGQIRDLTSVGVGVSQALPLLVGLLSCPLGSLFIVEQPELHLHPAVQGRLADFMLSARPDVSLIVETHSEAFITRVRRRAAEGGVDLARVAITFVEPDGKGSSARTLAISEFGDLSEWPEGFLSSSAEDIQAILAANIKRTSGLA